MRDFAIRANALTRDFGGVRAVDGLTLEIPAGAVFGLLGPNGSGKTTTIRLLLGLIEPTSGDANVLGFDARTQGGDVRARCGALLEHAGLYERLSANDNLELYGRIWHLEPHERRTRVKELLTHLGLWERKDEVVARWSRGMKQKLAVARALLHRPAVVFLDEPTSGLDPIAAKALREDLATLARAEAVTVLLTTHNLVEAETLCARIAVIDKGRLLTVGTPGEVRARVASSRFEVIGRGFSKQLEADLRARRDVARVELSDRRIVIELMQGAEVAPLVSLITRSGAEVEEARRERATLEDAFVDLVEAAR
jgi:ABC-2 type transport system ATP-binding protein